MVGAEMTFDITEAEVSGEGKVCGGNQRSLHRIMA